MKITRKKYQKNYFKDLDYCMLELLDFIIKIDPLKRLHRARKYSPEYTENIVKKVKKYNGAIFLAYDNKKIAGCIVGIIEKQSPENLLGCIPTKAGRILELFVEKKYRGSGIGKMLMGKMEKYMKSKKCDVMRVEVFDPNTTAHRFYKKLQFNDRVIDMIKLLDK